MDKNNDLIKDVTHVSGMYKNWFLDYASYVILERSVPLIEDGLKPVQRRILHSLKELDDGRFHKVANVVGHSMKYHPHGDASIYDAMVQIGQKNLLLDLQGNWGNTLTGDRAAAARYIEVKLSKFALEVIYNPKVTNYISSYDGRSKEPQNFPIKFPLLLAQGVEGIAVGLSTKILPHNFNELIDGSIKILKGKKAKIYPDFITGGTADFSLYNDGKRGGKVRVRAKLNIVDSKTISINELPFGATTTSLINSIIKANDKGKIKIKKIEDNTSENVEILVHLPSGISPDKSIDALYSFTDCELSISPLGCVIDNDKPRFLGVSEMLEISTNHTKEILKQELEVTLDEYENKWHYLSLEKIFIENRIYRDIEECESWDDVIVAIRKGITPFIQDLIKEVTDDDIIRLTEIKIKKISKFDLAKADHDLIKIEELIEGVKSNLADLTEYAISYFKDIKKKYGQGWVRKTEIKTFENIVAAKVVAKNQKLYVNREEGFIGTSLKRDEFVCECSDIDDVIVFRKDGKMLVTKVDKKTFVGKDIIHLGVFKKKDKRTTYNYIYRDNNSKNTYMKRFHVSSVTRDKEYNIAKSGNGECLYMTANPNGEAESVVVHLRALQKLKKLKIDVNFADLAIKGNLSVGNIVTKNPVKRVELKELGHSTLSARKIWYDPVVMKLNVEGRGDYLGEFSSNDKILVVYKSGTLSLINFDISRHFNDDLLLIEKWKPNKVISLVQFEGVKNQYYIKRFLVPENTANSSIISSSSGTRLEVISTNQNPSLKIEYIKEKNKDRKVSTININEFISVKGITALGNKLSGNNVKSFELIEGPEEDVVEISKENEEIQKEDTTIIIDENSTDNQFKLEL